MGKGRWYMCIWSNKNVLSWGDEKFLALKGAISESSLLWTSSLCLNGVSLNYSASDSIRSSSLNVKPACNYLLNL